MIHQEKELKGSSFKFDIRGEGILPTLKVIGVDLDGKIDFGSIRSEKSKIKSILIKNIGLIPATAVCRMLN